MGAVLGDAALAQDATRVRRHRAGDQAAFGELYEVYYPRLLRFVRRQVSERHLAEDLTQEAFARAFAAMGGLRDDARFYPWLTVIARRLVVSSYRSSGRVSAVADLDPGACEPADDLLLRRADQDDVLAALDRVSDRYREVLELREGESLSYDEIAERIGVPVTTVPPLLHRARRALRREYFAVTEHERASVVAPVLLGFADLLRRMRDRVLQTAAYFPDAHAFAGSVTVVTVSVGSVVALGFGPEPAPVLVEQSLAPSASWSAEEAWPPSDFLAVSGWAAGGEGDRQVGEFGAAEQMPLLKLTHQDEDEVWRRRDDDRHMPYYVEIHGFSAGADPEQMERDIESSLAGDHGWMEGGCNEIDGEQFCSPG